MIYDVNIYFENRISVILISIAPKERRRSLFLIFEALAQKIDIRAEDRQGNLIPMQNTSLRHNSQRGTEPGIPRIPFQHD